MARIKLLEKEDVGPVAREVYQKIEDSSGQVINLLKALAHSPKLCRDWNRMGVTLLMKGDLPSRLRELAILRVGSLAKAAYEWTKHVPMALQAGATQEQIDALPDWKGSALFDEKEKAVLAYTDQVACDIHVSEKTFESVAAFLSEKEIVELTATIGYYGMVCRMLNALQIELEE